MVVGMAAQLPLLRRGWGQHRERPKALLRWLYRSWALGVWAIIPSLLRYAGVPADFCKGWWMNLFLFHPLINQWGFHATIIGGVTLVGTFVLQYGVILVALFKNQKERVT